MDERILLAHGSGGKLSHELVEKTFLQAFSNLYLSKLDDSAVMETGFGRIAFTTDSYVVEPLFFPGGDIGKLAVCGTVNDLAMVGAKPLYLSISFLIEEGFSRQILEKIVSSVKAAAEEAEVKIVTGDTKVVGKGKADGIFINTTGLGVLPDGIEISGSNARPGDEVILSGCLGDHGMAVLSQREGLNFSTELKSDVVPLNKLVAEMLEVCPGIHCLRDPTRGGLATTLNEIAQKSGVSIQLEEKIPVREEVRAACEMLGLDPLYVANEGKLVAIVPAKEAEKVLEAMHQNPYGREAAIIGKIGQDRPGRVVLRTRFGTSRIIDMLAGDPLPRIC